MRRASITRRSASTRRCMKASSGPRAWPGAESAPGARAWKSPGSLSWCEAGLGFMPHAGQVGGPDVVREAVEVLGATRIAHGVAAAHDEALMRSLAERGICLCVCPSSNARIGLKPDYGVLARHGIPLTVNTDDPAMVGTTLAHELEVAEKDFGLSRSDLIEAAWSHRFGQRRSGSA